VLCTTLKRKLLRGGGHGPTVGWNARNDVKSLKISTTIKNPAFWNSNAGFFIKRYFTYS